MREGECDDDNFQEASREIVRDINEIQSRLDSHGEIALARLNTMKIFLKFSRLWYLCAEFKGNICVAAIKNK